MGEIIKTGKDALEISTLPYPQKRPYPEELFEKFPQVKTIVMLSVDAHSLGPSGIQIENRKPALFLSLEITPPNEITEGKSAAFNVTLKNPLRFIIVQAKGSSAYGDIYEKNGIHYYIMLAQKETEPVFSARKLKNFSQLTNALRSGGGLVPNKPVQVIIPA